MLVYMFYLKKGCKKMQKNIEKNAKKCMTNDKPELFTEQYLNW